MESEIPPWVGDTAGWAETVNVWRERLRDKRCLEVWERGTFHDKQGEAHDGYAYLRVQRRSKRRLCGVGIRACHQYWLMLAKEALPEWK